MHEESEGEPRYDDDLIPDIGESDWPDMVGYIKSVVSIRKAYTAFVPKEHGIGKPVSGGKEVLIRCPSPTHIDRHPSAWMQDREGLWYCAACGIGGDALDLAAFATGYPVPGYKTEPVLFGEVVEEVAERMGLTEEGARAAGFVSEIRPTEAVDASPEWPAEFTEAEMAEAHGLFEAFEATGVSNPKELAVRDVLARRAVRERSTELVSTSGGDSGSDPAGDRGESEAAPELEGATPHDSLTRELEVALTEMSINVDTSEMAWTYEDAVDKGLLVEIGMDPEFPHIPWQDILPPDSPLGKMMAAVCVNDIPDEYFLWCIYTALGSMVGRRVELLNYRSAVDPALWTVIIGSTGSSKSTVALEMDRILSKVAPVSGADGVKIIGVPASGERFLEQIRRDDLVGVGVGGGELMESKNAASFMYADEFSLLGSLMARAGSTLTSLMLQAYGLRRDYVLRPTESMSRVSFPVTGPMVSILSTTQPNRISELLGKFDVASGFMNRFVFGTGKPRRVCVPMMGLGPDYSVVEEQFQLIQNRLMNAEPFVSCGDKAHVDAPWQIGPDSGGLKRLRQWMHEQDESVRGKDEYTVDLLARRDLVILKLILIMAINRIAAGDDWKHWTEGDVEAAIAHYPNVKHGWLDTGARVLQSDDTRLEDWIVSRITEVGAVGMSRRDLSKLVPKSMRRSAKVFNETITALSNSGLIREVDLRQGGGKKSVKWIYPHNSDLIEEDAETP